MAHRGASAYAPENTFEAYDLALELGATGIELDVHETQDEVLVVVHDDTIERTLRGRETLSEHISELRWSDLSCLDAGSWFNEIRPDRARPEFARARVVRLDDVFDRYGRAISYFIELKHRPTSRCMEHNLTELIRQHSLHDAVTVGAFSRACLDRINALDPNVSLAQLFFADVPAESVRDALETLPSYCSGIGPSKDAIDRDLVCAAARAGVGVYTWTVNERAEMRHLVDLGVDGIVTDVPDALDEVLNETVRGAA